MLDEPLCQIKARRKIDFQSELRQFYGNIAVELPAIDGVEHSDVSGGGAPCLIEVVDVFAEDVECGAESAFVETGNDPQRVVDGFSCDIPIGDASNNSSRGCRLRGSSSESYPGPATTGVHETIGRWLAAYCY